MFGSYNSDGIIPNGTTASGYGGRPYLSQNEADVSHFAALGNGNRRDSKTGYIGTASEIAERYIQEGRRGELNDLYRRIT